MDRIDDVQEADGRRPLVISGSIEQECPTRADDGGFADGEDISDIVALAMKYGLSALEDRGFSNLTEAHDE